MTLHWWMHWFWVTVLVTLASTIEAAPHSQEDAEVEQHGNSDRQGRALYFPKTTTISTNTTSNVTQKNTTDNMDNAPSADVPNTTPNTAHPLDEITNSTQTKNSSNSEILKTVVNTTFLNTTMTESHNGTSISNKQNLTRPDFVKDDDSLERVSESRIVTEKPLSLETTFLQTRIPPIVETSKRIDTEESGMDTGVIAGISFAGLVLAALAGSTAFVLYRRRYLNKPQTLNDKCSNPDSSGYLDDSTVRDNSEEMYSLDNDSFLNSLEAMTIQNYWTDTVKHTKL